MKHMARLFFIALFYTGMWAAEQPLYIYPVGSFEHAGSSHLLVLMQWSLERIELYDWNSATGLMSKILMSLYTPACVTVLPDSTGFSFVDNGRIRIKRFEKRAVKSLDINKPIYGIELIRWLDNQSCYFHAKYDGHYGIYMVNLEEELVPVLTSSSADYMYPFIVGSLCFCIERTGRPSRLTYKVVRCRPGASPEVIATFGARPPTMLHMQSTCEGYVLTYEMQGPMVLFHYYQLICRDKDWTVRSLIDFRVPGVLLYGPNRLYESLLPFVPRIVDSYIYFSSYDSTAQKMVLYSYDRQTCAIKKCEVATLGHLFAPIFCGKRGWCGGTAFPHEIKSMQFS
jgi:hypothetical protein